MLKRAGVLLDGFSGNHVGDLNGVFYLFVPICLRELSAGNSLLCSPGGEHEASGYDEGGAVDLPIYARQFSYRLLQENKRRKQRGNDKIVEIQRAQKSGGKTLRAVKWWGYPFHYCRVFDETGKRSPSFLSSGREW